MSDMQNSSGAQVQRHRLADRLYHWLMAASMLVLLFTGFLPVLGVNFAWVDPHWIAGVILTVLVAYWMEVSFELPRLDWSYLPIGIVVLWVLSTLAVIEPARRAGSVPPAVATRTV